MTRKIRSSPRVATAVAALLLLAGCASMAPPLERPAAPVAAAFDAAAPSTTDARVLDDWRSYFTEPALQALIEAALANNRDLRAAVARVEQARAAWGIQRADRLPNLGADASVTRSHVPADLSITGASLTGNSWQVGVGMPSWELDFWGRVRSLDDAALARFLATEEARRAIGISLVAEVADGYLGLRELDERIALARRTVASRAETLRIFSRRVEVGSTSRLDQTQVRALLAQAETLLAQLEQARTARLDALVLLVGTRVDWQPAPADLDDRSLLAEPPAGLPSELLNRRPDILAAEQQLRAANASIGAARAAFFPRIALTARYGTASAELDGLFEAGSHAWTLAPSLALPLFDAGRNRAGLGLAEARRDEAVAGYERAVQAAFRDVSDALGARPWLARQVELGEATLAIQTERDRLARLRYDNGAASFLEVLDAQRELLAAQQQLVATRRAVLSNRVSLYAALGGGLPAPAAPAPTARTANP